MDTSSESLGTKPARLQDQCFSLFVHEEGEVFTWSTYRQCYTKYGISQQTLDLFLRTQGIPTVDIEEIDLPLAKEIYQVIWLDMQCDKYPSGAAYFIFNTTMLYGIGLVSQWVRLCYQQKLAYSPAVLISGIEMFRRRRDRSDPLWTGFGQSWTNRCSRTKSQALKMLAENPTEALGVTRSERV